MRMATVRAPSGRAATSTTRSPTSTNRSSLDPNNANDFNGRGLAYLDAKNYEQAIADFTKASELDPRYTFAISNRCWTRGLADRELRAALADCDAVLTMKPDDVATLDRRALVYMKMSEIEKAIADYDAVLRLDPDDALARYSRGVARERLGDVAGASADRAAAQLLQPGVADAFKKLGLR